MEKHPNWYAAFHPSSPSTNNVVESYNGLFKKSHTLRERLSVGLFLQKTKDAVYNCSIELNKDKFFREQATITP